MVKNITIVAKKIAGMKIFHLAITVEITMKIIGGISNRLVGK
jgi:hypothetical protein